jgi:hypothetical protein
MKKLRVALCVFGQPRTMEFCFPSIKKHILDVYHPDVFVASDYQGDKIKDLFHPIDIEIHPSDEEAKIIGDRRFRYGDIVSFPEDAQSSIRPYENLSFMFKAWECGELLRKREIRYGIYDVVIAIRFDAKFLSIQEIALPEENCIYIPRVDACQNTINEFGLHVSSTGQGGVGYGAQIFWGSSAVVKSILDSYIWSDTCYNETHRWCGEMMLKWFCDRNNIKVKYTDVTFMLIRGDNEHPRSHEAGYGKLLSETNYPEYLV